MIDTSWKWRMPRTRHPHMSIKETEKTKAVLITVETTPLSYGGMNYCIRDDKNRVLFSCGIFLKSISVNLLLKIYQDMWNDNKIDRLWYNYSKYEADRIAEEFRDIAKITRDKWTQEETVYGVPKKWKLYYSGNSIKCYREAK